MSEVPYGRVVFDFWGLPVKRGRRPVWMRCRCDAATLIVKLPHESAGPGKTSFCSLCHTGTETPAPRGATTATPREHLATP